MGSEGELLASHQRGSEQSQRLYWTEVALNHPKSEWLSSKSVYPPVCSALRRDWEGFS